MLSELNDCVSDDGTWSTEGDDVFKVHNVPADITSVRLRIALYTNETSRVPQHHVHKV